MGNILTYLQWRGDLSWKEHPFNEIDNLVLAELSYLKLDGIVPSLAEGGSVTVCEAAARWIAEGRSLAVQLPSDPNLLQQMAQSERFAGIRLSGYVNVIDPQQNKQFSALMAEPEDDSLYVAFRGTDETLIGWREDFNMSYEITAAQQQAAAYLEQVLENARYSVIRVGGHSKGGNLAVFASMMLPEKLQDRISVIFSNDGPGLCPDTTPEGKYEKIAGKIVRIRPQYCVVGRLFDHNDTGITVKSSEKGLMQHDAYSWEITGAHFDLAKEQDPDSIITNEIIDQWVESATPEQRRAFSAELFDALGAGGATTLQELSKSGINEFQEVLYGMIGRSSNKGRSVFGKLCRAVWNGIQKKKFCTKQMAGAAGMFAIGVFFMATPDYALRILGTVFFLWLLGYSSYQLHQQLKLKKNGKPTENGKLIFFSVIALIEIICIIKNSIAVFSINMIMMIFFGWRSWTQLHFSAGLRKKGSRIWGLPLTDAVLSCIFAVMAAVSSGETLADNILAVGAYLALCGMIGIGQGVFELYQAE